MDPVNMSLHVDESRSRKTGRSVNEHRLFTQNLTNTVQEEEPYKTHNCFDDDNNMNNQ